MYFNHQLKAQTITSFYCNDHFFSDLHTAVNEYLDENQLNKPFTPDILNDLDIFTTNIFLVFQVFPAISLVHSSRLCNKDYSFNLDDQCLRFILSFICENESKYKLNILLSPIANISVEPWYCKLDQFQSGFMRKFLSNIELFVEYTAYDNAMLRRIPSKNIANDYQPGTTAITTLIQNFRVKIQDYAHQYNRIVTKLTSLYIKYLFLCSCKPQIASIVNRTDSNNSTVNIEINNYTYNTIKKVIEMNDKELIKFKEEVNYNKQVLTTISDFYFILYGNHSKGYKAVSQLSLQFCYFHNKYSHIVMSSKDKLSMKKETDLFYDLLNFITSLTIPLNQFLNCYHYLLLKIILISRFQFTIDEVENLPIFQCLPSFLKSRIKTPSVYTQSSSVHSNHFLDMTKKLIYIQSNVLCGLKRLSQFVLCRKYNSSSIFHLLRYKSTDTYEPVLTIPRPLNSIYHQAQQSLFFTTGIYAYITINLSNKYCTLPVTLKLLKLNSATYVEVQFLCHPGPVETNGGNTPNKSGLVEPDHSPAYEQSIGSTRCTFMYNTIPEFAIKIDIKDIINISVGQRLCIDDTNSLYGDSILLTYKAIHSTQSVDLQVMELIFLSAVMEWYSFLKSIV